MAVKGINGFEITRINEIAMEQLSDHKIQTEKGKAELKRKQYKQNLIVLILPARICFSVL